MGEKHNPDSVVTVVERFLQALRDRKLAKATIKTRQIGLNKLLVFLAGARVERVQDITPQTLARFAGRLKEEGLSQNTVESYLRSARALLGWLEERGELFENPATRFRMPKRDRKLPRVPSQDSVHKLLAAPNLATVCGLRDRAILEVLYGTGVRLEELWRLDLLDADLAARTLRVHGKGRRERVLPLGETCSERLRDYLTKGRPRLVADAGPDQFAMWISSRGDGRLGKQSVEVMLRSRSRDADLEPTITPHDLRRAMATHMLQNGANPVHIQFMLGHASLRHLSEYLRLSIDEIKAMHEESKPGQ